jgi:ribosomal protein S25
MNYFKEENLPLPDFRLQSGGFLVTVFSPERLPEELSERLPEKSEKLPEKLPEKLSERLPEKSEKLPEKSERLPEKLGKTARRIVDEIENNSTVTLNELSDKLKISRAAVKKTYIQTQKIRNY